MIRPGAHTGDPYGPWFDHTFVVIDTETTGLTAADRVIELGIARFERGRLVDQWGTLIHPGMPIPAEATAIHGVSDQDVASYPRFSGSLAPALRLCRDAWPCAYNASFDRKMIQREMDQLRLSGLTLPFLNAHHRWIDPLVWVRLIRDRWSGNKLAQACEWLGIQPAAAHRATDDAIAAGQVLLALRDKMPNVTMTELLRRQEHYHQKQRAEMKAWFLKKGKPWND